MSDLEDQFRETFADQLLTRAERKTLARLLREEPLDERELGVIRAKVFQMASEEMSSVNDQKILEWTRRASNLLQPSPSHAQSEAFFSPGEDCLHAIQDEIRKARHQIDICVFTISDDRISDAILRAYQQGTRIRILTDNDKMYDRGSDIRKLRSEGIQIKIDDTGYHMHHKFAVFDRKRLLTGSYNWTRSAAEFNEENVIVTNDPPLVLAFARQFDSLWDTVGTKI